MPPISLQSTAAGYVRVLAARVPALRCSWAELQCSCPHGCTTRGAAVFRRASSSLTGNLWRQLKPRPSKPGKQHADAETYTVSFNRKASGHHDTQIQETVVDPYRWIQRANSQTLERMLRQQNKLTERHFGGKANPFIHDLTRTFAAQHAKEQHAESVGDAVLEGNFIYWSETDSLGYQDFYRQHVSIGTSIVGNRSHHELVASEHRLSSATNRAHITTLRPSRDGTFCAAIVESGSGGQAKVAIIPIDNAEPPGKRREGTGVRYLDTRGSINGLELIENDTKILFVEEDSLNTPCFVKVASLAALDDIDLIYHETDSRYVAAITKTSDGKYITINSNSKLDSEIRLFAADKPIMALGGGVLLQPRGAFTYYVESYGEWLYFLTNAFESPNFMLMRTKAAQPSLADGWEIVLPHSDSRAIKDGEIVGNHFVLHCQSELRDHLLAVDLKAIDSVAPEQVLAKGDHESSLRFVTRIDPPPGLGLGKLSYTPLPREQPIPASMHPESSQATNTPPPTLQRLLATSTLPTGLKATWTYDLLRDEVTEPRYAKPIDAAYFNPTEYLVTQLEIPSHDGVAIPVTIVKGAHLTERRPRPVLLRAYGAYGINVSTKCDALEKALLRHGWLVAFAHVRGGGELGGKWHSDGRVEKKENTILDYLSCAQGLISRGMTKAGLITGFGQSAGGLTVAAACNRQPHLFSCLLLRSPFVDVLSSMLDPELPLTLHEVDEWGDPLTSHAAFVRLRSLCPYQTLRKQPYPPVHITLAADDEVVPPWQGLKFAARVCDHSTSGNPFLISAVAHGGHFAITLEAEAVQTHMALESVEKRTT